MTGLDHPDDADRSGESKPPADRKSALPLPPFLEEARQWLTQWDPITRPEGPADWFKDSAGLHPFDPHAPDFDPANAWWLAELCRILYTPDAKEAPRAAYRDRPTREPFLEERTPFREILNLHKTANHVALYTMEGEADTAILCFRGTTRIRQWLMNLTAIPVTWDRLADSASDAEKAYVHQGFQLLFERLWPLVEPHLVGRQGRIIFAGHSLGGAFATMAAAISPVRPDLLMTFGSPRIGNRSFVERLEGIPVHRVVNHYDLVPLLPALEPKLGKRDFRHAGDLHLLGATPGSLATLAGPELPESPEWESPQPSQFIKAALGTSEPPDWAIDHAPANYAGKLLALARAQASPE